MNRKIRVADFAFTLSNVKDAALPQMLKIQKYNGLTYWMTLDSLDLMLSKHCLHHEFEKAFLNGIDIIEMVS